MMMMMMATATTALVDFFFDSFLALFYLTCVIKYAFGCVLLENY